MGLECFGIGGRKAKGVVGLQLGLLAGVGIDKRCLERFTDVEVRETTGIAIVFEDDFSEHALRDVRSGNRIGGFPRSLCRRALRERCHVIELVLQELREGEHRAAAECAAGRAVDVALGDGCRVNAREGVAPFLVDVLAKAVECRNIGHVIDVADVKLRQKPAPQERIDGLQRKQIGAGLVAPVLVCLHDEISELVFDVHLQVCSIAAFVAKVNSGTAIGIALDIDSSVRVIKFMV